jgi:hypothetical protein
VALSPRANFTDWATATFRRILIPTFVDREVSSGQRAGSSTAVNLSFLDRSRYFFFQEILEWLYKYTSGKYSHKIHFIFRTQRAGSWYVSIRSENILLKWTNIRKNILLWKLLRYGTRSHYLRRIILNICSSDLWTRMYGTMAVSMSVDWFSPQKVNWNNMFHVCMSDRDNKHKGDMNGVHNVLYEWYFRWLMRWIACRMSFCWLASRTGL